MTCFTVTAITAWGAVEVLGIDVAADPDPAEIDRLRELIGAALVVVLRDQYCTPEDQIRFASHFGELAPASPVLPGLPDHAQMLVMDNFAGTHADEWHADATFLARPNALSFLYGEIIPARGGNTFWASTRSAFDALGTAGASLQTMRALHSAGTLRDETGPDSASRPAPRYAVHPLVRRHPQTGRPALFINPGFTTRVLGLSRPTSDRLLNVLFNHMTAPRFTYSHAWRPGDLVIWDNQATIHRVVPDYTERRRVRRVSTRGPRPVAFAGL